MDNSQIMKRIEDENLWIAFMLIWFDQGRPPERSPDDPTSKISFKVIPSFYQASCFRIEENM
ncbi:hypothetical protein STEG23_031112, partial [Scotinomys teguina]